MQPTGIYVGVIRKVMTMNKSTFMHDIKKDTPAIQALQEALECGIVNMDNVQEQLMASKREQVKKSILIRLHHPLKRETDGEPTTSIRRVNESH